LKLKRLKTLICSFDVFKILSFAGKNSCSEMKKKEETARSVGKSYSFFEDVYDVVRQIPKGRVTSFGAIANYLGTKSSARMVGWAMNGAHNATPKVPAHRVLNRNGMLTGKAHFATATLMEELLLKEKIKVEKDTVVDFQKLFWDPAKELKL
jgi:methylated-DNA-protein-cysteine methyltransferase related protein